MYHVIGTGVTAVLLYLISYLFYRLNYFSFQFHKKLWNTILAVAFLATALSGLFTALQITYKWDLPFVKTILKWHVEFGIGLSFTGIFHFIWHLSFYGRIFEKQQVKDQAEAILIPASASVSTNLFVVGLVSSSMQLLFMREMLNISGGYELVTGIFLGSWLIGSSIGSAFAGNSKLADLKKINLIFAASPVIPLSLMFLLSRMFLNTGETPSFLVTLIFTFLILTPFCMVSGFTFVKLINFARIGNQFTPGKSFSIETIGGVVSGLLISILTSGILGTYQLILLIMLLSIGYVLLGYYLQNARVRFSLKLIILVTASLIILFHPDIIFRQILLPGIKITASKDTPYGNITTGEYHGEKSTFYDQRLLKYNDDVIEREENIHYAMLQSESPEKVILISGSLTSQLKEIIKYPVRNVVYIERDPALAKEPISAEDSSHVNLSIISSDAFRYIRKSGGTADVIILSVPPPSTLQLNRYYTTEFFRAVRKKLNAGGVFMCSPGQGNDYLNKESVDLYSSIYNSLISVFRNVRPVSGNKLYFIASDNDVSVSFCQLYEKRKITNVYVCPDYLSDDLIKKKSEEITGLMNPGVKPNRSAFPVASYHFQAFNFSRYSGEKTTSLVIMIAVFAAPVLVFRRRFMLMYFSASALAGFEIIVLLTLQITVGNMYQLTGLVIAGLMGGLAVGSRSKIRFLNSLKLTEKGILLLLFYLSIGLIYSSFLEIKYEIPILIIIIIASFVPALLTGQIFNEFTVSREGQSIVPSVYSADLAGSALGFILISGMVIPALGIRTALFLLSSLILIGILLGTDGKKL